MKVNRKMTAAAQTAMTMIVVWERGPFEGELAFALEVGVDEEQPRESRFVTQAVVLARVVERKEDVADPLPVFVMRTVPLRDVTTAVASAGEAEVLMICPAVFAWLLCD
jgi:hypothetical protein